MKRFYDWHITKTPDFWRTYYGQPELIKLFAYAHSIEAAKSAGYKYLQQYDVMSLPEYMPGVVRVWEPLVISNETYTQGDFWEYKYNLPAGWLTIDTLCDRYVDPNITLQNNIDFIVDKEVLYSRKQLPQIQLYIVKGTMTCTRISDDFGTLFDYSRYDSRQYRDNFGPLLSLLYTGASIPAVIGAINVAYQQPVSKYATENVLNITGNKIITDKYKYNIDAGQIIISPGQYLPQHSPLTRVADFYTYQHAIDFDTGIINQYVKTKWWEGKPIELFQKYAPDVRLTEESKNYMMDTYLKNFVSYLVVRFDTGLESPRYTLVQDIKRLLYDGLPIRTDLISSQAMSVYYDSVPDSVDWNALAFGTLDIWTGLDPIVRYGRNMLVEPFTPTYVFGETQIIKERGNERILTAQDHVNPVIYADTNYDRIFNPKGIRGIMDNSAQYTWEDEDTYSGGIRWAVGSTRYHILEYENQQFNGWSVQDAILPYLDVNYDYVYHRDYEDPTLVKIPFVSHTEVKKDRLDTHIIKDYARFRGADTSISSIDEPSVSSTVYGSFKKSRYFSPDDLFGWVKATGHLYLTSSKTIAAINGHMDSLTLPLSRRIPIGHMASTITLVSQITNIIFDPIAATNNIYMQYQIDGNGWQDTNGTIAIPAADVSMLSAQRYLQLRYIFNATNVTSAQLSQLSISINI